MKKIKITEQQKAMLDKNGAKLGKVDEMNIPRKYDRGAYKIVNK